MRLLIILFLSLNIFCLAWDSEKSNRDNIPTDSENLERIRVASEYIKYSIYPYDNTIGGESLYHIIDSMNMKLDNLNDVKAIYDGMLVTHTNNDSKGISNDLGKFSTLYNTTLTTGGIMNNMEMPTIQQMGYSYMQYIKSFSTYLYNDTMNNDNKTSDTYLAYPEKFSFIEPIAEKLDTENTDFQPETLKNVQGMSKLNTMNTYIDELAANLTVNPVDNGEDTSILAQNFDGNTTFTIDLSGIGTMWNTMINRIQPSGNTPQVRSGNVQANPFQSWVFQIRLRPNQDDYLYTFYTWWNSNEPFPKAAHYCLNAILYCFVFYYCYNYTKELWTK